MAKKQTRRSVSIRGSTYEQVRAYCERAGMSMSEFVEERVAQFFGAMAPAKPRRKANGNGDSRLGFDELHDAARHFTF